jgi:uncharacterized membrane protein YeaQ/YmgE (transglycosylase-associated protein family)
MKMDKRERYINQLCNSMAQKSTEELLSIWKENDRRVWVNETFEAIQRILISRKMELPDQIDQTGILNEEGKPVVQIPPESPSEPVMRQILRFIVIIFGASGAFVLWQRLNNGFAEAIDTGDWSYVVVWVIGAVLVLGVFWIASKL